MVAKYPKTLQWKTNYDNLVNKFEDLKCGDLFCGTSNGLDTFVGNFIFSKFYSYIFEIYDGDFVFLDENGIKQERRIVSAPNVINCFAKDISCNTKKRLLSYGLPIVVLRFKSNFKKSF